MRSFFNYSLLPLVLFPPSTCLGSVDGINESQHDLYANPAFHHPVKRLSVPSAERFEANYGRYAAKLENRDSLVRPDWEAATKRAKEYLQGWSVEDLVTLTSGIGWAKGRCVGNIAAIKTKDFPGLCLEDSPLGVRFADRVSVFPAGVNTAATFNRDLMRWRGIGLGKEFRGKGVHIALGPMMNMARVPEGGRNFEGFGADPWLAGEAAYETIVGMQSQGVQACAKHYLNNEQEHGRRTTTSEVDERTQHELYLHPFLRSVQAGVASVMCSYNLINDTYACENDVSLNKWLKKELNFEGYVMSDWDANHSTESANHGLDMTMPGDIQSDGTDKYFGNRLVQAVKDGKVKRERLEDMATRIVAAWFALGQDKDYPEVNFDAFTSWGKHIDVRDDHDKLIRTVGAASTVLLKNERSALPLIQPVSMVLIGSDAGPPLKGPNFYQDRAGLDGVLIQGWGSGTCDAPYVISPLEAIQSRAKDDHTSLSWFLDDFDLENAAKAAKGKDVAMVFIAATAGEEYLVVDGNVGDRNNLTAWHGGDDLVRTVAAHNSNTIVVVHSVGPIDMPWVDHENITAIVWAGVPGQEAGNALADVLYGDWNPSGRLPYTIARKESDYRVRIQWNRQQVHYNEDRSIDYRYFDAHLIEPLFEFGFGLSYTKFEYFGLQSSFSDDFAPEDAQWRAGKPTSKAHEVGSALQDWLHRKVFTVSFRIQNVGTRYGADIPQLYVGFPQENTGDPPRVLRGFDNVPLNPGETQTVEFKLSRYDLSIWSVQHQAWVAPPGKPLKYKLFLGTSSRDFKLKGTLQL
ncbi:Probable beta-glucosidase L; AltName: Full=Beta-D-glucoside glucohydrolase L; AltName: Full=Cellobiase L; AltName: Full=Gentiobiase L; Flags: Precursor [Serendipita indica DSM 11827]|uniref:beta-glucosidase n=1 Tax=Serendipita indica (strain DSM 11827) TaxID=1109443 RepID=G4T583_SERID|nr:Probable beta-glucosidase L; AltName: Full=Beta-D-glucoside glucohydrolase L; AltName: Full=Cellobiase L; AltName: Full=Gentiobiase L; Flags: Precursor [Serendipita indica DSM 11827]CCA66516.1 probable beta-glucosidase [Serendipita indica DSM 11827]